MKLFDDFEAVKFPEENLIFITKNEYLYYIYDPAYNSWKRHKNAGNDRLTVSNYPDVSREELIKALGGVFPQKETDFMRCCNPSQLRRWNLLALLREDYSAYMNNKEIYDTVTHFLSESNGCYKSYLKLKELFAAADSSKLDAEHILIQIKELCFSIIGRDIFKKEIRIIDGHDCSSYFWIQPVRIIDFTDTNEIDNVAEMNSAEISIEEDDVDQYLVPFLDKYYDDELEANKKRVESYWNGELSYISGFAWYLTYNFYSFDAIENMLKDIKDTMEALSVGRENEFTAKLKEKRGSATHKLLYAKDFTEEQIEEYNANRPKEDDTEKELIIDFYCRFIYRMEYMLKVGREKGYDLISFMGP